MTDKEKDDLALSAPDMKEEHDTTPELDRIIDRVLAYRPGGDLKIISDISEDLDKHEGRVKKKSRAIKRKVRSGARRTSGKLI